MVVLVPLAEPEPEGRVELEPALVDGDVADEPLPDEVVEPDVEGRVDEPEPLAEGVDVVEPVEGVVAEPDELVEPEA